MKPQTGKERAEAGLKAIGSRRTNIWIGLFSLSCPGFVAKPPVVSLVFGLVRRMNSTLPSRLVQGTVMNCSHRVLRKLHLCLQAGPVGTREVAAFTNQNIVGRGVYGFFFRRISLGTRTSAKSPIL